MYGSLHRLPYAKLLQLPERQHHQQQQYNQRLLKLSSQDKSAELLEHAHAEPSGYYARQVTESGGGHDNEQANRIGRTEEGLDIPDHGNERASGAADRRV